MFELPEFVTLARQINETLAGKIVQTGQLGNTPHKFVWYNRISAEFERLTEGKTMGATPAKGKWLFVALDPGYVLLFGECGGKMLYHPLEQPCFRLATNRKALAVTPESVSTPLWP